MNWTESMNDKHLHIDFPMGRSKIRLCPLEILDRSRLRVYCEQSNFVTKLIILDLAWCRGVSVSKRVNK